MASKVDKHVVQMLETPVDVKRLVDKLFFDIDDIETAAQKQPKLYLESGRFRAQMAMTLASNKRKLARVSGEKSIRIRKKSSTSLTETAIKTRLATDEELQSLQKRCDEYEVYEDFAKDLREAYKERLMILAVLARLRASETSSELRHVKADEERDRLSRRAKKVREAFEELEGEDD